MMLQLSHVPSIITKNCTCLTKHHVQHMGTQLENNKLGVLVSWMCVRERECFHLCGVNNGSVHHT